MNNGLDDDPNQILQSSINGESIYEIGLFANWKYMTDYSELAKK